MNTTAAQKSDQVQLAAFRVGDETYAVDIMRVREVIRALPLTPVREGRHNVDGILSLRGLIVPVVDLRRCFHRGCLRRCRSRSRNCARPRCCCSTSTTCSRRPLSAPKPTLRGVPVDVFVPARL
ncbi:MAG: hypothetical protein EOO40_13195 [Deltaproteobacteria bacterium]|nr:MAG: hypothetical protein EOO40_13195 [Deltaproteobacteria bacterium]